MKRFISIFTVIVFLLVFVLAGCGQQAPAASDKPADSTKTEAAKEPAKQDTAKAEEKKVKDSKDVTIGFVTLFTSHPAWQAVKQGAEAAAKEGGFKVLWNGAEDGNMQKVIETAETFIAQKVDGIAICALSPPAFTPVLEKAKKAGIVVTTYAVDAEKPELRAAYTGTDNAKAGKTHADALHKMLGKDDMKIGILMGNLDAANQMTQVKSLEEYIKDVKGAKIIDKRDNGGGGDDAKTLDTISAMLKAHPDINCIFETDGGGIAIVGKILDEMKLTGKVIAIGYDDLDRTIQAIKEGKVSGSMVQNFYKWGYYPTKYAFKKVIGEQVPDTTDSGVVLVTKENVDTYKQVLYKID